MMRNSSPLGIVCITVGCYLMTTASAFVRPTSTNYQKFIAAGTHPGERRGFNLQPNLDSTDARLHNSQLYNKIQEFFDPFESKIPEELREEIYKAEANTPAAQDRGTRVAVYALLAVFGIALASFNGFLTDMRDKEYATAMATAATSIPDTGNNLYILEQNGFGWVLSNPLFKFLFTNKIGGIITLLFGGGAGILAEAEYDSKRVNAEKIYEELERRREQKLKGPKKKKKQGKKRRSGKETKRLAAISEVVMEDAPATAAEAATKSSSSVGIPVTPEVKTEDDSAKEDSSTEAKAEDSEKKGMFGKMKELYEKADSMAASQALIMNKNLEDAGVIEKITDESGLKVIGREEAKKLEEKKSADE